MTRQYCLWLCFAGLAGCEASLSPTGSGALTGLTVRAELLASEPAELPRAIRITFENSTVEPVVLQVPGPVCPEGMPGDTTRLALVLTDPNGRESQWTPMLTELFEANIPAPESRSLSPGESWSKEYDLGQLYIWGPCGPAVPISDFLSRGTEGAQFQVVIVPSQGAPLRSQPVKVSCAVASWLFDEPGSPRIIGGAAQDDTRAEGAHSKEERRRHDAALRAMRKMLANAGKEPEQEGKPISHWLEQYCDDGARWAEDDELAAAPRIKARGAVMRMGAQAVPFLLAAFELEDELGDCAVDLLHELYEAGRVPDQVLVAALRGGSENVRGRIVEALDARFDSSTSGRRPATLSPGLVAALVDTMQAHESVLFPRYEAASALGRPGLKEAVPALTQALEDEDGLLRAMAARALAAIGPDARGAIPALRALAQASVGGEKSAARSALLALGEKLADFTDFCERMAAYSQERLAKEPVEESSEAQLPVSFPGVEGIFFIVDRSGTSMPGLRLAQRYIPKVLSKLGEDAEFGIVFVDRQAKSHPNGGRPAKAKQEEKAAALEVVLKAQGGSGSCPARGFETALDFCEASPAQRKVILYIGDGGGTCPGEQDEAGYLQRMCDEVTRRNAGRAAIQAIGIDAGPCGEGTLLYLTERNAGRYTRLVRGARR